MNYKNYAYSIGMVIYHPDTGESFDISQSLSQLMILNDYDKNVFPIYNMQFMSNKKLYNLIKKDFNNLKYTITIKSVITGSQNSALTFSDFYNRDLELLPMNKPNFILKDINDTGRPIPDSKDICITMAFLPKDIILFNRTMVNGILNDSNVLEAVLYSGSKVNSRINIETPFNSKKYKQIVLPPLNVINSIKFIQNQYGIYPTGLSMFYKDGKLNVKSKQNNIKSNKNMSNVSLIFSKFIQGNTLENGEGTIYDREINSYKFMSSLDRLNIINDEIIFDELYGNNNIIYHNNFGNIQTERFEKDPINKDKTKVYMSNIHNDMATTEFFDTLNNPIRLTLTYNTANLNMWDFNNIFKINIKSDSKKDDIFIDKLFQVSKNEMVFTVRNGLANLDGNVYLKEIYKINY